MLLLLEKAVGMGNGEREKDVPHVPHDDGDADRGKHTHTL